mgnify:CR=1 FL=1
MYQLVIAEKPSVAQSLAAVLGAGQRREGYLEGNGWLVSWCVGLVCAMLLWWLDAGFVSDVSWDIALLYGFGASLVANGVADTGLVQWVIGLFRKKREEAE